MLADGLEQMLSEWLFLPTSKEVLSDEMATMISLKTGP